MILAPAVRHGTGRPGISMGGGIVDCVNYKKTMERLLTVVCMSLYFIQELILNG
jgi:hypothetical protein